MNISSGYDQWADMRGKRQEFPIPKDYLTYYMDHLAELQLAQFLECHPDSTLHIEDLEVPVSYSPSTSETASEDGLPTPESMKNASEKSDINIPVRKYTPDTLSGAGLIVWFHGGGYIAGDLSTEDATCRQLALLSRNVVINVAYRNMEYPVPFRDGWDAVLWAISSTVNSSIVSPHRRFFVGGTSYGAHLATTLALHASAVGLNPPFTGQILRSPVTLHPETPLGFLPSMERSHPLITAEHLKFWWSVYNPPKHLITAPSVSPLLAQVNTLPPSYLQITTADPHADEGLQYAEKLRASYVPVKVDMYDEPHAFWALPRIIGAASAMKDLIEGIQWLQQGGREVSDKWDTGIREEVIQWTSDAETGEGMEAWRRKKLCDVAGCGCYM